MSSFGVISGTQPQRRSRGRDTAVHIIPPVAVLSVDPGMMAYFIAYYHGKRAWMEGQREDG